jgi:hypothetical protein
MKLALTEIARRIDAYLKRFEADPAINILTCRRYIHPYWKAGAYQTGRYVGIKYVSFQGAFNLTREEAEKYLDWLDAGNIGRHIH